MSDRPTHGYCPECREDSAIGFDGSCLWCGGPTQQRSRVKRGGWQRPDLRGAKYTEDQLRVLHLAHERGESINALAKQTYERVGYKSHGSAASAICREWKRMGLRARDRIEATVRASTKHGLSPKHGPRPGYAAYKRRVLRGEADQPDCIGVRSQPPRKGEPCGRPSMVGSDFCFNHDPDNRDEIEAILVDARLKMPTREMVPMAPFTAWLQQRREDLGSWDAVGESVERSTAAVHRYGNGLGTDGQPKSEIGRETVEALLEVDGTATFPDLYSQSVFASSTTRKAA